MATVKISLTGRVNFDQYGDASAQFDDQRAVPELELSTAKPTAAELEELREHLAGRVRAFGRELDRQLDVLAQKASERERRAKREEKIDAPTTDVPF